MSFHPCRAWALRRNAAFIRRRRVEFGFHGFHQIFGGVLGATQARVFFFDFANFAVDLVARGFGQGVEEFQEAFGLAEFTGESGMDGHAKRKTLPRMTRISDGEESAYLQKAVTQTTTWHSL